MSESSVPAIPNTVKIWDGEKFVWAPAPTVPPPPVVPGGNTLGPVAGPGTVIGATNLWTLIQAVAGGYTLTWGTITPGVLYQIQHVGGAAGTNRLETTGQAVTLSRGSNTFTMEDPQQRMVPATANPTNTSVLLTTSEVVYPFMLDATNNVLRVMRMVR
jgi:hypothetical protein